MVAGDEDSTRCAGSLRRLDSDAAALLVPSPGTSDRVTSLPRDDPFQTLQLGPTTG